MPGNDSDVNVISRFYLFPSAPVDGSVYHDITHETFIALQIILSLHAVCYMQQLDFKIELLAGLPGMAE